MTEANRYQRMTIDQLNDEFIQACTLGNLKTVKYLLTSPHLKENVNIHVNNDDGVSFACVEGHFEVFTYLLNSSLFDKSKYNYDLDFKHCCRRHKTEFIDYFIFDYKIEKNPNIDDFILKNGRQDIINKFELRSLNANLTNHLSDVNVQSIKKLKV